MTAPPPVTPPAAPPVAADRVPGRLPVLMYHGVPADPAETGDPLRVPVPRLREQLAALVADGRRLLGLTAAVAALRADPAARVVAVTFDDAYADFLGALDVLAEVGAGATLYVPTARVGTGSGATAVLGWRQLAGIAALGVEIGSHTVRHRPLDVLPAAELRAELADSGRDLRDRLGVPVTSLGYPHGYTSARVRAELAAAGYETAVTVGRRVSGPRDGLHAVPRVQPLPGTDGPGIVRLADRGEPGPGPHLRRVLQPPWRGVRRASLALLRRELT